MPVSSLTGPLKRVCKLIFFSGIVKEPLVTAQIWKQFSPIGRMSHKGKEGPWHFKGRFIGNPLRGHSGQGRCGKFECPLHGAVDCRAPSVEWDRRICRVGNLNKLEGHPGTGGQQPDRLLIIHEYRKAMIFDRPRVWSPRFGIGG